MKKPKIDAQKVLNAMREKTIPLIQSVEKQGDLANTDYRTLRVFNAGLEILVVGVVQVLNSIGDQQ